MEALSREDNPSGIDLAQVKLAVLLPFGSGLAVHPRNPATFPDECPDAPARLVEPLEIHGDLLAEAYVYARDNDGWLALVDRGLESGEILLEGILGVSKEVAPGLPERGDD